MRAIGLMSALLVAVCGGPLCADACGDKFLTAVCGTGAPRGSDSATQARVILYQPPEISSTMGVRDPGLEKHIRASGWEVEVTNGIDSLRAALARGTAVVLVDLPHFDDVRSDVVAIEADTVFVPVMSQPSRSAYREAAKDHTFLMRTPSGRGHVQSVLTEALQGGA
jgi:hypothetical protein